VCSSSILLLQVTLASSVNGGSMIIRVRLGDGSMEKLSIPKGTEDTMTLKQVLSSVEGVESEENPKKKAKGVSLRIGSKNVKDTSQTLSSLGIKHGSLITVIPPPVDKEKLKKEKEEQLLSAASNSDRFDPFPDLARDYKSALRKTKARRTGSGGMSYGDIARMQSSFHVVEPQPKGPIERVYMCASSAERFQSNCLVTKKPKKKGEKATTAIQNRVALLLGTTNRERVDTKPVKVRTSLSSSPADRDYCNVIKVHALYEPPQTPSSTYDCKELMKWSDQSPTMKRVINVASQLGLEPVGWIFTYDKPRHDEKKGDDNGALPVWGSDVKTGASLQISKMKNAKDRAEGAKFTTLAMDATVGATEAFQLSDVCVQMVAENILGDEVERHLSTKIPIIVDSKETKKLDSVLCLVNTAMLTHEGMHSGSSSNTKKVNPLKKNGTLTIKTKKKLLDALNKYDATKATNNLFEILSDFNVLVGLDPMIPPTDMSEICRLVKKWARGQRRGTFMDEKRILLLKSVLGG